MQQSIAGVLSLTEMFDNLTNTQLELVASICEPLTTKKGEVLFEENDASDELYVISRGGVEILVNPGFVGLNEEIKPVVIAELRQGQVLGEVALVDQGLRSATARISQDDTQLLRLPRKRLMLLCDTYPELGYKLMKNLAADLALKMRNTDLIVRQYQLRLSGRE
ncbi:MAG: cyclic nucleotide-binding domain-containing protein [Chloroflexi bacterium]|nr:cyclic nucleotide-binding domain-containing protein [Chloroflexota bacterium]MCI0577074.1 cyclic nucleotide-binding domain-containing protein [Chloroflexota bacterium]MCI0650160.1 cyclic nucleotide-binding domain-containing protein [Chloroflexota bacterium]MCI0728015.1 cyclic nucleotide-binding domain-containing protein [Chloroflexota bacterium]